MSIPALRWVPTCKDIKNPCTRVLLYALANISDKDGVCYPGQNTLAEWTSLDVRSVRRHLKILEDGGYLKIVQRRNGFQVYSNEYHLNIPAQFYETKRQKQQDSSDTVRTDSPIRSGQTDTIDADTQSSTMRTESAFCLADTQSSNTKDNKEDTKVITRKIINISSETDSEIKIVSEIPIKNVKQDKYAEQVQDVFECWQLEMGYASRSLTDGRRRVIVSRLKDKFSVDDLKDAIRGVAKQDFFKGTHDDLVSIFKNAERVERHRDFFRNIQNNGVQNNGYKSRQEQSNDNFRKTFDIINGLKARAGIGTYQQDTDNKQLELTSGGADSDVCVSVG